MSRTHSPAKLSLAIWFSALVLAFGAQDMSAATVTYIVGTCKSGTRFSTIQSALDASPAPNTVEVCPGISSEQVTISHPVTLEGITEGNGSLAQIELPSDYTVNASVIAGGRTEPAIAQVYVNDVSGGSVNLTNLNVNGVGFGTNDIIFIGVLYNQSSGTINQVTTSAQNTSGGATNVDGWGMWIQGGSSKPAVTVENSSVHDFNGGGILAVGETAAPDLTVTIKKNVVSSDAEGTNDIVVEEGTDPTVSGNIVSGVGDYGIIILDSCVDGIDYGQHVPRQSNWNRVGCRWRVGDIKQYLRRRDVRDRRGCNCSERVDSRGQHNPDREISHLRRQ